MNNNYKPGDNITIMNTLYQKPRQENGEWINDSMTIIYKDLDTGVNHFDYIEQPTFKYHKLLPEYVTNYMQFCVPIENTVEVETNYNKLDKSIATEIGRLEDFKYNKRVGDYKANRAMHTDPSIYSSDGSIDNYYRAQFARTFKNDTPHSIKKGFFDIEVDGTRSKYDFPDYGEVPIISTAYYNSDKNEITQFILKYEYNKQCMDFYNNFNGNILKQVKSFIIQSVGGEDRAKSFNLYDIKIRTLFFDTEMDLLYTLFDIIRKDKLDFVLFYSKFDMKYIIERIKALGYNPSSIICDPDIPNPICEYYIDEKHLDNPAKAKDCAYISSRTVYIDQMQHYTGRRGNETFASTKLDVIGENVAGVRKLNYSHITDDLPKLPFLDFMTFYLYGFMDVIVQHCIEFISNDIEYLLAKALNTDTPYNSLHKQSTYLRNLVAKKLYAKGLIIGNNTNGGNKKIPYRGGLVGKPYNVNEYPRLVLNNRVVNIADRIIDEDFTSLYPSTTIQHNLFVDTLLGSIHIPNQIYKNENRFNVDLYSRSGEMIDNYCSNIPIEFCNRYFNMASIMEFMEDIEEYKNNNGLNNDMVSPITITNNDYIEPIKILPNEIFNEYMYNKNNKDMNKPSYYCKGV